MVKKWKIEKGAIIASVEGLRITNGLPDTKDVIAHIYPWAEANANLIVTAVNACLEYKDPQVVAESIEDMVDFTKELKALLEETGRPTTQKQILYDVVCETLTQLEEK